MTQKITITTTDAWLFFVWVAGLYLGYRVGLRIGRRLAAFADKLTRMEP